MNIQAIACLHPRGLSSSTPSGGRRLGQLTLCQRPSCPKRLPLLQGRAAHPWKSIILTSLPSLLSPPGLLVALAFWWRLCPEEVGDRGAPGRRCPRLPCQTSSLHPEPRATNPAGDIPVWKKQLLEMSSKRCLITGSTIKEV